MSETETQRVEMSFRDKGGRSSRDKSDLIRSSNLFSPQDWKCPCGNINWARRERCNEVKRKKKRRKLIKSY